MVSVSEGTPGRGPDAQPRTESGDGQASTDGRPAVPPVRYGPRNGPPGANGRNGSTGRTVSGSSAPQQHRGTPAPRPANGSPSTGPNGAGPGSTGSNGTGSNGTGSSGAHAAAPSAYTRPRTNAAPARPGPSEQERLVSDARTAAAARNASAAKVRGGSAPSGTRAPTAQAPAAVDETAVIPVVQPDQAKSGAPADPSAAGPAAPEDTAATTDKGRGRFGRLRERRPTKDAPASSVADVQAPAAPAEAPTTTPAESSTPAATGEATPEPSAAPAQQQEPATEDRPLTWRDRLGLAPKEPKPQPVGPEAGTPAAASAAPAAAAAAVVGAAVTEAKGPSGPGAAPQPTVPQDRVAPSAPVQAVPSDTVEIPAVDAAPVGPAATKAQAMASAKAKVGAARRTRKARLRLSRVDPWSVMKTALLFSIAAGIILVVATYGVWSVLNASGLFDAVNDMVKSVVSTPGDTTPFRIEEYVNTQKIIGVAALIAVVDVLIFTALATLGSFLYNLAATVLGGLEVTLAED